MQDKLRLYYRRGSCALAPHIALEWSKVDYELVRAGDDLSKLNPAGAVPVLVIEGGDVLMQAGAILAYIAERYAPSLLGTLDPLARARLQQWSSFFTGDLHPAYFPIFVPARYTTDEGDQARARVRAAGVQIVHNKLAILDRHLADRLHLHEDSMTILDAYAVPFVRWANRVDDIDLDRYANLKSFYLRMLEDPAVQRAMAQQGIEP